MNLCGQRPDQTGQAGQAVSTKKRDRQAAMDLRIEQNAKLKMDGQRQGHRQSAETKVRRVS